MFLIHRFIYKNSILKTPILLLPAVMVLIVLRGNSQVTFSPHEALFSTPKHYIVGHTNNPPLIDGDLEEASWEEADWTDAFTDIEGSKKPEPRYNTKVKMVFTDSFLFVAAQLEEPHVWATVTKRDAIIYHDNDFEVFINPAGNGHQYYEIEVNALNTIMDLMMHKPYRNGANALLGFDLCGLRSSVQVQGTLNDGADKDQGWTVEMAIPFSALLAGNSWKAPAEGCMWRINFSRVQWNTDFNDAHYVKKKDAKSKLLPEYNWVWSEQGVINMHYPERWGYLQFTRKKESDLAFSLPYNEKRRPFLWLVYYKQKAYWQKHGKYAASLPDLGLQATELLVDGQKNKLLMEATSRQFTVYLQDGKTAVALNNEGLVEQTNAL